MLINCVLFSQHCVYIMIKIFFCNVNRSKVDGMFNEKIIQHRRAIVIVFAIITVLSVIAQFFCVSKL